MLDDLVIFAQQTDDPILRSGRSDVVLRMMRMQKRAQEKEEPDGDTGN